MSVSLFRLYKHAVEIKPAADMPAEITRDPARKKAIGLGDADRQGWVLLCPHSFIATWNGGSRPEDIEIVVEGTSEEEPPFVRSLHGDGRITFFPGYQFKCMDGSVLWLRGPVNAPRDGIAPKETRIDASLLPSTATIDWQFTRPNQSIRFAAGEPFATLLRCPKTSLKNVDVVIVEPDLDAEAHVSAFQEMVDTYALRSVLARLSGNPQAEPTQRPGAQGSKAPAPWAAQLKSTPLKSTPGVSCICPTYARVEQLEEAIQSFLQQDYPGPKELIVLNDYAGQTLCFDHPDIKIINRTERYASVGEKYNAAVALASHDLIFVWHDDDIYLPHRISFSVAQCEDGRVFFKGENAWFWNDGHVSGPEKNTFHGGSCFRRALFDKVHGYPTINQRYDADFEQRCQGAAIGPIKIASLMLEEVYYIYRWNGTGSYHFSTMGEEVPTRQSVKSYVEQQAARGQIPQGRIQLTPRWKSDYAAQISQHIAALPTHQHNKKVQATRVVDDIPYPPPFFEIPPPPPLSADEAANLFRGDYPLHISVILPAANESVLLKRTVDQFAKTLPPNSEVIVVDNGSIDGSADFMLEQPRENVHLIRTPDMLGVSGARNRGLLQAKGEVVVFADAHIDLPERWWEPLVVALKRPEVGVIGPGIGVMGLPKAPIACGQRIADSKLRLQWLPWRSINACQVPTLGGGMMAMRHDTLKKAGAFDAGMPQWGSEDLELCVRYWLLGYEVWVAPSVSVLHYFRKTNPYKVEWGAVTHNLLRVALLHFNNKRLARVIEALKVNPKFANVLAHAVDTDVWQKRAEFAARRVRDDDWLFNKFADTCEV